MGILIEPLTCAFEEVVEVVVIHFYLGEYGVTPAQLVYNQGIRSLLVQHAIDFVLQLGLLLDLALFRERFLHIHSILNALTLACLNENLGFAW